MITELKISDFKAHHNTALKLSNLTLLTGVNSSGKSSVLQSLLLLRQSYKKGRLGKGLDLNAPLCDIGKGSDALYRQSKDDMITFEINTQEGNHVWTFDVEGKFDDTYLPLIYDTSRIGNIDNYSIKSVQAKLAEYTNWSLFTNDFQYISSSRWANLNQYPMDTFAVEEERQISLQYGQGELVAHFLDYYGQHRNFEVVLPLLLHPSVESRKLLDQTIAWENEISPRITLQTIRQNDKIQIEFGYKTNTMTAPLSGLQAKNVGFGISYSLSIVVALLSAKPGALLLIENPEAHLHPRGQSKLAELIARAAESGVQIMVETHSDHLFNGILKAVHAGTLQRENVKIHYFGLDDDNISIPTEIEFNEKGRIENPQKGFFDQFDDDLDDLLDI